MNKDNFIILPRIIMEDSSLNKSDCFLFGNIYYLSKLYGYCFATNKTLSTLSYIKLRTLNYSLKRLQEKGYIKIIRIKEQDKIQRRIYVNMQIDSS